MNPDGRPHPQHTADKVLARLERDEQIIELTRRGKAVREIAREVGCGVSVVSEVRKAAIAEARDYRFADSLMYAAQSMDRLGALLNAIWDRAMTGDHQHVAEARRIVADMDAITGARAPIKVELTPESAIDADIRRLVEELDRRAAGPVGQPAPVEGAQG